MEKKCKETIMAMNFPEEVKEVLLGFDRVTSFSNARLKNNVPGIILRANNGSGITEFAKCIDMILRENRIYSVHGAKTYLEMSFPVKGDEDDYLNFFEKPRIVSQTQNLFYGVMTIYMTGWDDKNLLINNEHFDDLMEFIEINKSNICFVICVPFDANKSFMSAFESEINKRLRTIDVSLPSPNMEMAFEYIKNGLKKDGIKFTAKGSTRLREAVEKILDIKSSEYQGYKTLDQIISSIEYELCKRVECTDEKVKVNDITMNAIEEHIKSPTGKNPDTINPFGFSA